MPGFEGMSAVLRLGWAALSLGAVFAVSAIAVPALAQEKPPLGTEGTAPGLEGGDGAKPGDKGTGPNGVGMPPGGGLPPDKRSGPPAVAGTYSLIGRNVNGSSYNGRVAVRRTGETYRVVWRVGNQTFVGTGILTGRILSVAYNGGLAVYWFSPQGIKGRWATTNATRIATEDWTRQ